MTRTAECQCGQLKVECEGEPVRVSVCYCTLCQRRTGSAFGVQARFPEDRVRPVGEYRVYERVGDTNSKVWMHHCPQCASTVFWNLEGLPGFTAVAVGAFADPTFPPPVLTVYEDRRAPWSGLPDELIKERYN